MSPDAIAGIAFLVAALAVLVAIGVTLAGAARQALRIKKRTDAYAALVAGWSAQAGASAARLEAAATQIEPLAHRATAAVDALRRTGLPAGFVPAVRLTIAAVRALTGVLHHA